MTKYVLNSGGMKNNIPGAKKFVAELVKGLGKNPKILFCFFAEKRENWEEKFPGYVQGFTDWSPKGVKPRIQLAFPETFVEQIARSDIVYIHGGDDHLVRYWLKQFDLPKIWEGKVVGTNFGKHPRCLRKLLDVRLERNPGWIRAATNQNARSLQICLWG